MTVAAQHTWAAWSISCKALPSLGLSKLCNAQNLHSGGTCSVCHQRRLCAWLQPHLVKPLPSSLMTIQQWGSKESSNSNCLTYSNLLLAMQTCLRHS